MWLSPSYCIDQPVEGKQSCHVLRRGLGNALIDSTPWLVPLLQRSSRILDGDHTPSHADVLFGLRAGSSKLVTLGLHDTSRVRSQLDVDRITSVRWNCNILGEIL